MTPDATVTPWRFIVIMVAILVAYFFLYVMQSFNVQVEVGGICAGIAVRLLADFVTGFLCGAHE